MKGGGRGKAGFSQFSTNTSFSLSLKGSSMLSIMGHRCRSFNAFQLPTPSFPQPNLPFSAKMDFGSCLANPVPL